MAKNTTTAFEFGTYEAPVKANPYAELMAAFLAATESNPLASYTLTVESDKAVTERNKFSKAANEVGKTANLRGTTEENGQTHMTFTLGKRHKARRGTNKA